MSITDKTPSALLTDIDTLRSSLTELLDMFWNHRQTLVIIANMPSDLDPLWQLSWIKRIAREEIYGPEQTLTTGTVGEASQPTVERQGVIDPASAQVHHSS